MATPWGYTLLLEMHSPDPREQGLPVEVRLVGIEAADGAEDFTVGKAGDRAGGGAVVGENSGPVVGVWVGRIRIRRTEWQLGDVF